MSKDTENQEDTIEIEEVAKAEPTAFATEGLLPEEVEMAEEHGLIEEEKDEESSKEVDESSKEDEDDKHEEQPEAETEDSEEEVKPKTFEEVESDENKLKKFNPNEQALYWKWKSDKKKKQRAIKDYEELKSKHELGTVKDRARLKKISEILKGDNVTVEALQEIIGETESDDTPLTKAEYQRIESEKAEIAKETKESADDKAERINTAENIGKTKYDNFDELTTLAQQVVETDKTGTYRSILDASFNDKDTDEEQLVERVVTIAKLHPDFGNKKDSDSSKKEQPETNADRAIKNSKKKIGSASLSSGGGKRNVAESELTSDDVINMSQKKWNSLKSSTRARLLQ